MEEQIHCMTTKSKLQLAVYKQTINTNGNISAKIGRSDRPESDINWQQESVCLGFCPYNYRSKVNTWSQTLHYIVKVTGPCAFYMSSLFIVWSEGCKFIWMHQVYSSTLILYVILFKRKVLYYWKLVPPNIKAMIKILLF